MGCFGYWVSWSFAFRAFGCLGAYKGFYALGSQGCLGHNLSIFALRLRGLSIRFWPLGVPRCSNPAGPGQILEFKGQGKSKPKPLNPKQP